MFLLAASYYFYMCWKAEYLLLILISTVVDYYAGIRMGKREDGKGRKYYLVLSLLCNLGLLFAFKYFNFFSDSLRTVLNSFNLFYDMPTFRVLLPVGISFYTFQTLSYTIDVYRGRRKPEKHFGIFALYVSFFPQLVAGPIERSTRLLPQFYRENRFDYDRITNGLKLMLWGFFKKLVIADRVGVLVDTIYNDPGSHTGFPLILATVFFAFQIYCDFSGYSDIAIGAAQILGYDLMRNFNRPYFSKSIGEFWKRWHISLSTWFRDYLYIPLGGNRAAAGRWYLNLFLTFLISGLWHGANWTFVLWGALNGFYLIFSIRTFYYRRRFTEFIGLSRLPVLHRYIKVAVTFALTCFAWIFFRANNISDAFYIINSMVSGSVKTVNCLPAWDKSAALELMSRGRLGLDREELIIAFLAIAFMELVHLIQRKHSIRRMFANKPMWFRWSVYYAMTIAIVLFGKFDQRQFIYFQF